MKHYSYLVGALLLLAGFIFIYNSYTSYNVDEQLASFPIPVAAELDKQTDYSKHFHWKGATGTELKLTYLMAIKFAGWKQVPIDGQMMQFSKNGVDVSVIPSTDYLEVIIER